MSDNNEIASEYQSALQLANSGNFDLAIDKLKACVDIDMSYQNALLQLAGLYLQTSQLENALETYSLARTTEKFESEAVAGMAKIQRLLGDAESAYDFIQQQIRSLKPDISIILAYSEICLELKRYSEAIQKVQDFLNSNNINSVDDKKNLLHTLGKLYDKNEEYEKAFQAHRSANELTISQYNPKQFQNRLAKIQSTYTDYFLKNCNYSSIFNVFNKISQPVFIVGMPRSGTTLIEQILSCHTEIYAAGELPTIQKLVARMCKGGYPEQMKQIDSATLNDCAQLYINQECSKQHPFTTDKMPHNYLYLGVIRQLFPNSKIINVNRDPIDNCLSIYFQFFNDSHRYATNLSNIAHHYAGHSKLMDYWKLQFPENIIDIQYEEIVNNTQHEITRILDSLGLKWQDSCLRHDNSKRHVLTASQQQVNKPIYKQSIKRWKNYESFILPLLSDLKSYNQI